MSELLDEVLAADGGAARWHAVTAITAHSTGGGVLPLASPASLNAV